MDAIQEETELSQPDLDKELWKELLSAAKSSRLTTAPKTVVPLSLSHRSLLQMTHLPSFHHQGLRSPGSSGILCSSWWQKRTQLKGLLLFLLAELQQLHSILCCQRAESYQKWTKLLSERYCFAQTSPRPKLPYNEKKQIMKAWSTLGTNLLAFHRVTFEIDLLLGTTGANQSWNTSSLMFPRNGCIPAYKPCRAGLLK